MTDRGDLPWSGVGRGRPRWESTTAERILAARSETPAAAERATVKSARRVLEIFEYIASKGKPVTVAEVATSLGYPRSSTSVLIQTLRQMRYVEDGPEGGIAATLRLSLVGSRIRHRGPSAGELTDFMLDLQRTSAANVILGVENGTMARYIQFLPSNDPEFAMRIGALRPICHCAIGKALLMTRPEAEVDRLVRRINCEAPDDQQVERHGFLSMLSDARSQGYAYSESPAVGNAAGIAIPLPSSLSEVPLALGIAGPVATIRARRGDLVERLRSTVQAIRSVD